MPKMDVDFYANKQKGLAPLYVTFYPIVDIEFGNLQDTTDSLVLLQDTTDSTTDYQDIT
jgi:hypothetical protein